MANNIPDQNSSAAASDNSIEPTVNLAESKRLRFSPLLGLIPPLGLVWAAYLGIGRKLRNRRLALFTLLPSLVAAAFYLFLYINYINVSPSKYIYKTLDQYSIPSGQPSGSFTFKIPPEFTRTTDSRTLVIQTFQHELKKGSTVTLIGSLSAVALPITTNENLSSFLSSLKESFNKDSTDKGYQSVANPISLFIKATSPNHFTLNLGHAQALKTSNIKDDRAWEFNVSGSDNSNPPNKIQGKAIYAWGKKGIYYFVITADGKNWKNNSTIWQQIIDSIKIDQ